MTDPNAEDIQRIENDLRTEVQHGLTRLQSEIFGQGDIIILSALGIDGSRKLLEILIEEAQKQLDQLK